MDHAPLAGPRHSRADRVADSDDPNSSNNQADFFGVEIEATTKVYVRNIRVKKIN